MVVVSHFVPVVVMPGGVAGAEYARGCKALYSFQVQPFSCMRAEG